MRVRIGIRGECFKPPSPGTAQNMFFHSWYDLGRLALVGIVVYALLVAMVRISGKRTLAKMNALDFVVTAALGSTLATVLLSGDVALVEGAAALALLVVLQLVATWAAVRSRRMRALLKSAPSTLLCDGWFGEQEMRAQRVTAGEARQAVRAGGIGDLWLVAAVVLETDGSFSVVPANQAGNCSTLPHTDSLQDRRPADDGRRSAWSVT